MTGSNSLRLVLASGTALAALCLLPNAAFAQSTNSDQTTAPASTPTGAAAPVSDDQGDRAGKSNEIIITGSRIKQDPNNSALPLTIITNQDLQRNSISSPEQLIMLSQLAGTDLQLSAMDYQALAGAQLDILKFSEALRSQLNVQAATFGDLLNMDKIIQVLFQSLILLEPFSVNSHSRGCGIS